MDGPGTLWWESMGDGGYECVYPVGSVGLGGGL